MKKLNSFAEFSAAKVEVNTAKLQEEQDAKLSKEAKTFTSLLSEYGVTAIKELDEDQKTEFFEKLRGAKVNEATELIEEGTRGQFGKIDKKGNIVSIYTHYDSYPENVLPLIKKGYKGGKNVDAVIKGGNSSGLEATPADMNFYKDGSKNLKGSIANVDGYLQAASDDGGAEFVYLWDVANKEWLMADIYGNRELVPAFENLSVSVNEAIKVEYKRDAKKVVTQYKKIFYKALPDLGAMSTTSILGCVKYICQEALGDANFHREAEPTAKKIKGKIEALEIKMPGLGGHFVKIGSTTIKSILDKHYSDIANAAGWSGIGIAEGTALFLEELKQEQMGQDVLDAFNAIYAANESVVTEAKTISFAKASMLGSKLLNKIKIGTIIDTKGGQYEVTGFGQQANAFKEFEATIDGKEVKVKLTAMYGLKLEVTDDVRSARFNKEEEINSIILESVVNEASSDLKVGDSGIDYNDNVVEIIAIGRFAKIAKMFKKETKEDAEDYGIEELMVNTDYYLTKNIESPEGNVGDYYIYPVRYDMANYWGLDPLKESVVNEAKFKKGQNIKSKVDSDDFNGDVYDRTNEVDGSEILKNSSFEIYEIGKDEVVLWSDADQVEYSIDPDDLKNFVKESVVTEAEIKSEEDFKEYAYGILKKAFGEEFDQAKADEVVDGILSKSDGDYGKAAGILQSSLT